MKHIICVVLLSWLVVACTHASLDELRAVEPSGNAFQTKLSEYYLALAEEEQTEGRYRSSQFMAEKGLAAAYGEEVFAEVPRDGVLYAGYESTLVEGKKALDAITVTDAATKHPDAYARLQTLYDCWLVRAEADAPVNRIQQCQQQFYNHLALLRHQVQQGGASGSISGSRLSAAVATSYLIYFEWDRSILSARALDQLRKVAQEILAINEPFELVLNGHADTSGDAGYNMKLSERRAVSVRDLLATFGVPKDIMSVFAFGETDPDIAAGDGVREPKNRRVEIFIE